MYRILTFSSPHTDVLCLLDQSGLAIYLGKRSMTATVTAVSHRSLRWGILHSITDSLTVRHGLVQNNAASNLNIFIGPLITKSYVYFVCRWHVLST